MTCNTLATASVSNPTGSIKGNSFTGLVDAYTGNWSASGGTYDTTSPSIGTAQAQAQHVVMLSNVSGACNREGCGGSYASNELNLRFTFVLYADLPNSVATIPPTADLPITFQVNQWVTTSDGAHRQITPYWTKARSNGGAGSPVAATSGVVTITSADANQYSGTYDIYFGSDRVTGSFVAPWCV